MLESAGNFQPKTVQVDLRAIHLMAAFYTPDRESAQIEENLLNGLTNHALVLCGILPPGPEAVSGVSSHVTAYGAIPERLLAWAKERDVEELAQKGILVSVEEAQKQATAVLERVPSYIPENRRMLWAVNDIAAAVYGEKRRQSGKLFSEHPKRGGAMALYTFDKLQKIGCPISQEEVEAVICGVFCHDGVEEGTPSTVPFDPRRPQTKFTPLLIHQVMRLCGSTNSHGLQTMLITLRTVYTTNIPFSLLMD